MEYKDVTERILHEVRKAVIGKDEVLERVLCAILARGHILIEDIPGLGKTTMALAFADVCNLSTRRMQFTPDVLPSDIIGFNLLDKSDYTSKFMPGSVFTHLFLADEINRTSPKTQSALLEVMEEGNVTVEGVTYELEKPFIVIATQNPSGSAGTQLLPESQLDRFMIQVSMGYPKEADELEILKNKRLLQERPEIQQAVSREQLLELQDMVDKVYLHDAIYSYIVALIQATRKNEYLELGASPRASVALMKMSAASALMAGRDYVAPRDVMKVFPDVVRHRIMLNSKARIEKVGKTQIVETILNKVEKPGKAAG